MRRARLTLVLASLPSLALGLAACGSAGGSGGAPRTVTRTVNTLSTPPVSTSTPSTTTPSASTPATTPHTTTTPASTPACVAADLALTFIGQRGAAGHGELAFALKNTGQSACHTYGYPGILFLDSHGSGLTTIPHHTTLDYFGHAPEVALNVNPGNEVSFRLGVTHGAIPGSVCTTAAGLQVIPPDDTATLRATIPGGAYECRDATVSPLQPGTSAYR
jgi:Protein of unknown function (DUF4232)